MDEKIFDPVQLLLRANNATIASQAFRIVKLETDREEQQQMFLAASREISELQMLATNIERRAEEAETALAAMTAERDARDVAIGVLGAGVRGGQVARFLMRRCPATSEGAGGQTVGECLSRQRFHNVALSIFADLYAAEETINANPLARAAVEGDR